MQTGQSYSTGGARSAWAACSNQCHRKDICQTPPPSLAPPASVSPSLDSWKPQAVTAVSLQGWPPPQQSQDLQVGASGGRHWREARRGLRDALVTDAQTRQTQTSHITDPCEISCSSVLGETAQMSEPTAGCRTRQRQRTVHNTHLCLGRLHPWLD